MRPTTTAEEFLARIHEVTTDSPYVVTETDHGFHLQLNMVDARWYTLMHKNGVKKMVRYEVKLSPGQPELQHHRRGHHDALVGRCRWRRTPSGRIHELQPRPDHGRLG